LLINFLSLIFSLISDGLVKSEESSPEGWNFPVRYAAEWSKNCPIKKEKTAVWKTGL